MRADVETGMQLSTTCPSRDPDAGLATSNLGGWDDRGFKCQLLHLPDKWKHHFPLVLGANTIKGKSNDFILVETVILPHASIFYENI